MELTNIIVLIILFGPLFLLPVWKIWYQYKHKELHYFKLNWYWREIKDWQRHPIHIIIGIGIAGYIFIVNHNTSVQVGAAILIVTSLILLYQYFLYRDK